MERNHIVSNLEIELNTNTASEQDPKSDIYEVMHMDRLVASVSSSGAAKIFNRKFMPYDLYLEEEGAEVDIVYRKIYYGTPWRNCRGRK